jgi:hypothetical protein
MPSDPVSRAPSRAEHDAALTLEVSNLYRVFDGSFAEQLVSRLKDLALARGANIQRSAQGKHPFGTSTSWPILGRAATF